MCEFGSIELPLPSDDQEIRSFVAAFNGMLRRMRKQQDQVKRNEKAAALGVLVSGVAHELNNPLTAILAFGQDLLATARSEADQEALAVIVQQAQRCRVIVCDLLLFARNQREQRRRVAVEEVTQRVLRLFERDSARIGVRFEAELATDLPPVEIDVVGIEQVLINLLTNAFHATPEGGVVTLRARVEGDRLELSSSMVKPASAFFWFVKRKGCCGGCLAPTANAG